MPSTAVVIPASTAIALAAWIERCGRPTTPDDQRLALAFIATLRRPTTLELNPPTHGEP